MYVPGSIVWRNEFTEACPWVLGRTVAGVKNGPSPEWLRKRLESIGLRPINTLVDITNFFTIDLGRPLHVFDADKVTGGYLQLQRGAGETFTGLHGKPVTVGTEDCVIADANGAQSLAGIVGGEATGCDEGTTNVFIECALFDRVRDCADRPTPCDLLRCAAAFRARNRFAVIARGAGCGDGDGAGAVRRGGE